MCLLKRLFDNKKANSDRSYALKTPYNVAKFLWLVLFVSCFSMSASAQLGVGDATMGVTGAGVSGEIEFMSVDDMNDPFSSGVMVIAGQAWIIPANLLIDLPANRLTLQQLFMQAPSEALAFGESGLVKGDSSLRGRGGATAHLLGNQMADGRNIAGDVFIQKDVDTISGRVSYINYEQGYVRLNGDSGSDSGGVMVRINDPDSIHTIQNGLGCSDGPNCSPDVRFTNDPDNYTVCFLTGYPLCIPSTQTGGNRTTGSDANGEGDPFCPQANRDGVQQSGGILADDSTLFAPLRMGDNVGAEGNKEVVDGVAFFSAHTFGVNRAILTRDTPDQPSYVLADEAEWDAPGFANERAKALFIGFSSLVDSQVNVYALYIDPSTNENHERILASSVNNPMNINHGIGPGGGSIFKMVYDVDFLKGAPVGPRRSPCTQLRISGFDVCPNLGSMDEEFALVSPIAREIVMVSTHEAELLPGVTALNLQGEPAQHDRYLTPAGVGHPEFGEIDLNRMWWPMIFAGEPWNLDRRLGPGGCADVNGDNIVDCEDINLVTVGELRLDPFPFSGLNPITGVQGGLNINIIDPGIPDPIAGEICNNGIDDEGDFLIDCDDPECTLDNFCILLEQAGGEIGEAGFCGNFLDDDGDGLADCADPECAFTIDCAGIGANLGLQFVPGNMERAFGYWPFTYEDIDGDPLNGAETLVDRIYWENLQLLPAAGTGPMDIPEIAGPCSNLNGAPQPALGGQLGIDLDLNQSSTLVITQADIVTDPDSDHINLTFGNGSQGGSLQFLNGNYIYTPATGFTGTETFEYTATDPHGGATQGTLRFDVSQP